MHGPPVTVHVTSLTRRVFSDRINVRTMVPHVLSHRLLLDDVPVVDALEAAIRAG